MLRCKFFPLSFLISLKLDLRELHAFLGQQVVLKLPGQVLKADFALLDLIYLFTVLQAAHK